MKIAEIIHLKINLTKIDKTALFKSEETGNIYLDAALLLREEDDQYGHRGMLVQSLPEARRSAGEKGNILGNAKILERKSAEVLDDDLPF